MKTCQAGGHPIPADEKLVETCYGWICTDCIRVLHLEWTVLLEAEK